MNKKDQEIIDANPSAAPYDLLIKHGLSKKGYTELVEKADKIAQNTSNTPTTKIHSKQFVSNEPVSLPKTGTVKVLNLKNNRLVDMAASVAQRMQKRYPNEFQIKQ